MPDKSPPLKMVLARLRALDRALPDTHGQEGEKSEAKQLRKEGVGDGLSLSVDD